MRCMRSPAKGSRRHRFSSFAGMIGPANPGSLGDPAGTISPGRSLRGMWVDKANDNWTDLSTISIYVVCGISNSMNPCRFSYHHVGSRPSPASFNRFVGYAGLGSLESLALSARIPWSSRIRGMRCCRSAPQIPRTLQVPHLDLGYAGPLEYADPGSIGFRVLEPSKRGAYP